MTVWLYTDPYASWVAEDEADRTGKTPQEVEYEAIERHIREALPAETILFVRGRTPADLRNGCPDVYVWDIGGMCQVDHSGQMRGDWTRTVIAQIEDHPSTAFVPWSVFSQQYARGAVDDLIEEKTFGAYPPNLLLVAEASLYEGDLDATLGGLIRKWRAT